MNYIHKQPPLPHIIEIYCVSLPHLPTLARAIQTQMVTGLPWRYYNSLCHMSCKVPEPRVMMSVGVVSVCIIMSVMVVFLIILRGYTD